MSSLVDKGKVLLTELYPLVKKGLSKKENTMKLKNAVGNFLDRNNEKLTTIGPIHRIIFSDEDINVLYEAIEVDPQTIKGFIKSSSVIKSQWQIMNNPFNSGIAMAIRYYKLHNNEEMVNILLVYLTLSMYPSIHFKYFQYEPNENVMNYTINNLSNKFKIKQLGTIYAALLDTTQVCYQSYGGGIARGYDKDIVDFIMGEKTRLNSLIQKIANEYYDNKTEGKYMNSDNDSYDEDNYHEADSNTYLIERMANNVVLRLVVDGPNIKLISVAAKTCQVSVSELRNYVNLMVISSNRDDIKAVIESILFLFLFDSQNTVQQISSNEFLLYCMEVYKKSNTTDENILKIKRILDSWLEDLGTYKKTQRLATINNFRRALYAFFVLSIMNSANR